MIPWWTTRKLNSKKARSRARAARALGDARYRPAIPKLVELLDDTSSVGYPAEHVGEIAGLALARMGPAAVEPLLAELGAGRGIKAERAAAALGVIGDVRAVQPLIDVVHRASDSYFAGTAVWALGQLADERVLPLLETVLNDDERPDHVRETAAAEISRLTGAAVFHSRAEKPASDVDRMFCDVVDPWWRDNGIAEAPDFAGLRRDIAAYSARCRHAAWNDIGHWFIGGKGGTEARELLGLQCLTEALLSWPTNASAAWAAFAHAARPDLAALEERLSRLPRPEEAGDEAANRPLVEDLRTILGEPGAEPER